MSLCIDLRLLDAVHSIIVCNDCSHLSRWLLIATVTITDLVGRVLLPTNPQLHDRQVLWAMPTLQFVADSDKNWCQGGSQQSFFGLMIS
jgi:hypothetical protein